VSRLEVADIFRAHGPTWRRQERGHLSLAQLKVMSAVERCRSAELGGHALRCSSCAQPQIAYNSCRNRHCPKCQGSSARRWLQARCADRLPVDYYHVVFTLPAPLSALAYTNKELMYGLLFDIAADTLRTIAADPKHLGARIGLTLVLHTSACATRRLPSSTALRASRQSNTQKEHPDRSCTAALSASPAHYGSQRSGRLCTTADIPVSALRCPDDHHRDLATCSAHPCTTDPGCFSMRSPRLAHATSPPALHCSSADTIPFGFALNKARQLPALRAAERSSLIQHRSLLRILLKSACTRSCARHLDILQIPIAPPHC
jgi:hypothetical protein